ncbi:hypothetical protein HPP92_004153 [Vanilla planifolia]|uniref:Pentatricopeptide repeat-containing protein n=1 Tax=Vanilla planifolia TaxID=51239 RepID=A0A835S4Z8_VANPL|nr:hypothetical protein HPP92_004585 [Vanilla planifolia]KAG0504081.1 hypothetical protein HPP92_004153 [Vanilla planifolia]
MFYKPNKLCFLNLFKPSRSEALRFFCCQVGKKGLHAIFCFNVEISRLLSKGDSDTARNVFERMSQRTVVSWNVIISGYAKLGRLDESLNMVSRMHRSNTRLNETTFTCAISCCARYGSCWLGKQLHCLVLKSGFEDFELVGCAMLNMYTSSFEIDYALRLFESFDGRNPLLWSLMLVGFVKCNMMGSALELFERMPNRDVVSWTALISSYSGSVSVVECSQALELFVLLIRSAEAVPNEFTYDCVIRVCSKLEHADFGKMVHGLLLRCGFESDCCIKGALIYFYCNCGDLEDARQIYGEMINPCLSTSNAIIAGLVAAGRVGDAEIVFGRMPEPGPFSYNQMIKGYAQEGRVAKAKTLFEKNALQEFSIIEHHDVSVPQER